MASRMDEREVLRVLGQLYYRLRGTTRALGLNDKDYPRTLPQGVKPIKNREPLDERDLVRLTELTRIELELLRTYALDAQFQREARTREEKSGRSNYRNT